MTDLVHSPGLKPYKVQPKQFMGQSYWAVVEQPTDLVLGSFVEPRAAKMLANAFNGGLGFRGWTPNYFLQRVEPTGVKDE